jgi:hypothetical protein
MNEEKKEEGRMVVSPVLRRRDVWVFKRYQNWDKRAWRVRRL